ncbi:hypothetical protein GCM10023170_067750 [Phytohabitans houttuyneae]|uniref:Golgi phosphoprotein 3 GPP34 n=1 Tax=Phytohabitans houttuyneae TaxID=1076126 RepID=A0A6V8JXN6_9ACTN|nr:hypothetical protein Phou_016720 [Phytohabitans houttuyneae]
MLAELLYLQKIVVQAGRVYVVTTSAPGDALAHRVLAEVAAERGAVAVGTWLTVLGQDSYEQVAERLERNGRVRAQVSRRRLVMAQTRYVPTDVNEAGWPAARLSLALRQRRRLAAQDEALAALMWATGLDRYVLDGAPAHAYTQLRALVSHHLWPPMAELAQHTHAAVGKAVAAHRS